MAAAQEPCPDPAPLLDRADQHLADGEYPQADQLFSVARAGFSCGQPPSTEVLAHFWLTAGALAYLKDDRNGSFEAFAAAAVTKPDLWIQPYGSRLRGVYDSAAVGITGSGTLAVEPEPARGQRTWVDGSALGLPATVDAGLHLFQLGDRDGVFLHELVVVPEDGLATVAWVPPEPLETAKTPRTARRGDRDGPPFLLYGAAGAGALSGLSAVGALLQNGVMNRADSTEDVNAAYRRQVAFAAGSYTLFAGAATGLVLHVAL